MTTEDKIIEEFENLFDNRSEVESVQKEEIKDFLRNALQQQRKDLLQNEKTINKMLDDAEIEGFRADLIEKIEKVEEPVGEAKQFAYEQSWYVGYNQAIEDIIKIIQEK